MTFLLPRNQKEPQSHFEQQPAALHQELETVRPEREEALSPFSGLSKATKAANGADPVIQDRVNDQVVKSPQFALQDVDYNQDPTRKGDAYNFIRRPPSQGSPEDNSTSLKWWRRQIRKEVLKQKVTKNMLREAIKLYDLEKSY